MNKSLSGLLRDTWRRCKRDWRGLAIASLLPFLLAATFSSIQLWQMRDVHAIGLGLKLTPGLASEDILKKLVEDRYPLFIGFLIFDVLIVAWHFTRLVHFLKSGAVRAFSLTPGELRDTAAVVVYGIFVWAVLLAAYLALILLVGIMTTSVPFLFTFNAATGLGIMAMLVMLAMVMRFLVGFPGIAQGGTPRLLRDLWPIAKGATFSLTWRSLMLGAIFFVVALVLSMILMGPLMALSETDVFTSAGDDQGPETALTLVYFMIPALVIGQFVRAGFIAVFSTFLTLAYARLSGQEAGTETI